MESFNLTFLLIFVFLLVLLLICSLLFVIIKKVKWGFLYILIFFVFIVVAVKIHDQIINSVFYNFKSEMCRTYPEINNIELKTISGGTSCVIYVDLQKEIKDEYLEEIFVDILKRINKEPMSSFLKGSNNRKYRSWGFLHIDFLGNKEGEFDSELYEHSEWFTEDNQQIQTWKNSITGKIYHFSDYIN